MTTVTERPAMELHLLGGFELASGGAPIALMPGAQRVLAFVALTGRPLQRGYVAGSLWTDKSDARAAANLRSVLWRLRRPGLDVVDATATHVALSSRLRVDVREAEVAARRLLRGETTDVTIERETWLRGDLLPDWYDDWLLIEQERYRQLRLHALEILSRAYTRSGDYGRAVDAGLAAVAAEPLRESAHRCLIEAHLAEGNRFEALRHFESYRRRLREQIGEDPSSETAALLGIS